MKKTSHLLFCSIAGFVLLLGSCKKDGSDSAAVPTITALSPAMGGTGDTLTLTGSNFSAITTANDVKFNDIAAAVIEASATSLKVVLPAGVGVDTILLSVSVTLNAKTGTYSTRFNKIARITTLAGSTVSGFADGDGKTARFNFIQGIAVDNSGVVFVCDRGNARIRKIAPNGTVSTLAGNGGVGHADGTGTSATFNTLNAIGADGANNLIVGENDGTIRKITQLGVVTTFIPQTNPTNNGILAPMGFVFDATANLYITNISRIGKFSSSGILSIFAGGYTGGPTGFEDGLGTAAAFGTALGITKDAAGNFYVCDTYCIRKITPAGNVTTFAGTNKTPGFTDGTGIAAQLNNPTGIATDATGNMYICDQLNNAIRKLTPSGVVTTLMGKSRTAPYIDGNIADVGIYKPAGIAIDHAGNLYIYSSADTRVRKVTF